MEIFNWLIEWYKSNCDGDWEHGYGIRIETVDNPGWLVDINITDTDFEDKDFEGITVDNGDNDWYFCKIENGFFKGRGDPDKLITILEIFRRWITN